MYREIFLSQKAIATVLHGEVGTPALSVALLSNARIAAMDATYSCLEPKRGWFPDCGVILQLIKLQVFSIYFKVK